MSIAIIANAAAGATGASTGATTGAVNGTGANFAAIAAMPWGNTGFGAGTHAVGDSLSNSYTGLTSYINSDCLVRIWIKENPTVSSSMTFNGSGPDTYITVCGVLASGVKLSGATDQQNGANAGSGTTLNTGSVTPSENNELFLAAINHENAGAVSINSSFTILNSIDFVGGQHFGGTLAYKIGSSAENPQFTYPSGEAAAAIATFKAAAGNRRRRLLLAA